MSDDCRGLEGGWRTFFVRLRIFFCAGSKGSPAAVVVASALEPGGGDMGESKARPEAFSGGGDLGPEVD